MKILSTVVFLGLLIIGCGKELDKEAALEKSSARSFGSYTSPYTSSTSTVPSYPPPTYPTPIYPGDEVAAGSFTCSVQNGACLNGAGGSTCKSGGQYGLCGFSAGVCGCILP